MLSLNRKLIRSTVTLKQTQLSTGILATHNATKTLAKR
jgi:hypothetical protein